MITNCKALVREVADELLPTLTAAQRKWALEDTDSGDTFLEFAVHTEDGESFTLLVGEASNREPSDSQYFGWGEVAANDSRTTVRNELREAVEIAFEEYCDAFDIENDL